jgi:drug/metabolite transporter (DMT)-like permease
VPSPNTTEHGQTTATRARRPLARQRLSLFAALAVGVVAISFSAIFIKWSDAPAAIVGLYRLLFSLPLLAPMVIKARRQLFTLSLRDWGWLALSGTLLGLHFLCWIGSFAYTSVASSMILLSLQPVFVMIGAFLLFGERTRALAVLSMALAMCGILIVGWGDVRHPGGALWGDLLSLLGTLAVSGYMLVGQGLRNRVSSSIYSFLVFAIAALLLGGYVIAAGIPFQPYPQRAWLMFALLAIVPTMFGHVLFNWLLKNVSATTISIAILGEPVGAIVLAWLLLGTPIQIFQAIGGLLTIGGVWLFLKTNQPADANTETSVPARLDRPSD